MAAKKTKKDGKQTDNTIALNRQAGHEYYIEEQFEAGLVLEGWEVKSLRDGRAQLKESYVDIHRGEAWLCGAHISPLLSASTHVNPIAVRRKKLLLHRRELNKLIGVVLSFNVWSSHKLFDKNLFECLDYLTANLMLPLGGLAIALFAGWIMHERDSEHELELPEPAFKAWRFLLKYISAPAVFLVFLHVLGVF